jgi:hypothetical protein
VWVWLGSSTKEREREREREKEREQQQQAHATKKGLGHMRSVRKGLGTWEQQTLTKILVVGE